MRGRTAVISLIIILILVAIVYWLLQRQQYETTDNAYLKANKVLISAKVQGYVSQRLIDDNQRVKQGDVLVVIDDRDYQARLAQAEANMLAQKAQINRLKAMKQVQQARINSAKADVEAAKIKLALLRKDLKRFNNLIRQGSASTQSLDNIQTQVKQTAAELSSHEAQLLAEKGQLLTLDSDIEATKANLKSAQAQWQLAKLDLENTRVRAPFDGIIGRRGVEVGQLVTPGLALAYLVEDNKIWLEANFKETQVEFMRPGQPVEIHVDAYPDKTFYGEVKSFSPATGSEFSILPPENATGNFTKIVRRVPVKIVFDSDQDIRLLKPGFSVVVSVKVR
ncbi:HlyD family secretion protein [methane-oxidizing endosymbiont of Gigantopelta aegis]|uniref:HlyD family secretion protein n=1 Tax=methane-oxidizing endosymbiont of Gigantopelta aegis TaxID=2794938 RepID=UPI0018DBB109|nr:HlyD family secretion protein [methane-oxidizing endosymbiont of Gigantopelta aegis]